jgi:hypothetical protein
MAISGSGTVIFDFLLERFSDNKITSPRALLENQREKLIMACGYMRATTIRQ